MQTKTDTGEVEASFMFMRIKLRRQTKPEMKEDLGKGNNGQEEYIGLVVGLRPLMIEGGRSKSGT